MKRPFNQLESTSASASEQPNTEVELPPKHPQSSLKRSKLRPPASPPALDLPLNACSANTFFTATRVAVISPPTETSGLDTIIAALPNLSITP